MNARTIYEDKTSFHRPKAITGILCGKEILLFTGRRHFYEGYPAETVLQFVNIAAEYGAKLMVITNAAGGVNPALNVSDLMVITSFVNFLSARLPNYGRLNKFDPMPARRLISLAAKNGIGVRSGVYCCNTGPNYETSAETGWMQSVKFDAIGMSTVPEIITAQRLGMKVAAVSCISNLLRQNSSLETSHEGVMDACKRAHHRLTSLIELILLNSESIAAC